MIIVIITPVFVGTSHAKMPGTIPFGQEVNAMFRIYGAIGSGENGYAGTTDDLYRGGGGQFFLVEGYTLFYAAFGLDLGYTSFGKSNPPTGPVVSGYFNTLLVLELHLLLVNFQFGFGPAFGVGSGTSSGSAIMIGTGFNLMLLSNTGLSLMYRSDWVFDRKTATSDAFLLGVNFYI